MSDLGDRTEPLSAPPLAQAEVARARRPLDYGRLLEALKARDAQQALLLKLAQAQRESGDAGQIRAVAAEALGKHLDASVCAFIAAEDEKPATLAGHWTEGEAPPLGVLTCCTEALQEGVAFVVPDTLAGPEWMTPLAEEGVRAVLCVPLEREGALRGCLLVGGASARRWDELEVDLVRDAAARTSEAVERAEAEAALREERRTLEKLNEVGAALAAELDLERVVQKVTDAGVELTGAHFGAFFYNVLDPQGESYMLYTLSGVDRSEFGDFPMPRNTSVFAPTFGGEGVLRSDDILTDARYGKNTPHRGMPEGHLPVRSYLAVPVASRSGEVLGGLFFGHPEPARFQARHERLMVAVAAQAAIAIDNARLFKAAQVDLAERRVAEARLQELNDTLEERIAQATAQRVEVEEALRQSQKLEAVGQLTGGVAHDFNNLLTIIRSSVDFLKRPDLTTARRDRYVAAISETVERASKLTGQLLAFARRQPLKPEVSDVGARVQAVGELVRPLVGSRISIRGHHQPVVIEHAAEDDAFRSHPTPALYGFRSYASFPILLPDGRFFGTLCAIDPKPARLNTPEVVGTFTLFAELIAFHIDAHERLASSAADLLDEKRTAELREQFIAVLGHDLRNPLASIEAGSTLLRRQPLDEQGRSVITMMQASAGRMAGLIDNVLDFARGRLGGGISLVLTPTPLTVALEQVVGELRAAHPERTVETDFALDRDVVCDVRRLSQLFSNLVGNALSHGAADQPVRTRAMIESGDLVVSVTNGGTPIPSSALPKLFLPFERGSLRANLNGLGLGLYISSEVARAHHGRLSVESGPTETVFTFRMPLSSDG